MENGKVITIEQVVEKIEALPDGDKKKVLERINRIVERATKRVEREKKRQEKKERRVQFYIERLKKLGINIEKI